MKFVWLLLLFLPAAAGCQALRVRPLHETAEYQQSLINAPRFEKSPVQTAGSDSTNAVPQPVPAPQKIRPVSFENKSGRQEMAHAVASEHRTESTGEWPQIEAQSPAELTLEQLQQRMLQVHPDLLAVQAELESLRGKWIQAGLQNNPVLGWASEDMGEEGQGGRHGVIVGREVIRRDKLAASRHVVSAEIAAVQQQMETLRIRLLTDVRMRFYDLLVAQEKRVVADQLVEISRQAAAASQRLFEAREVARSAVLQSELELQTALIVQAQALNQQRAAQRQLAALVAENDFENLTIAGDPRHILRLIDLEQLYDQLLAASPELAAAFAQVDLARQQLQREHVEVLPNVIWEATLQYDTASDHLVTGFQFAVPLPTVNRNQGAILEARHQIIVAEQKAAAKAINLRQRLVDAYEAYTEAQIQADAYHQQILPRAKQTLELISGGYEQGEVSFLEWLTAQRTYSQTNLMYFDKLKQVWRRGAEIQGMLLHDSMGRPSDRP